jgi:hypothetical protein
MKRQVKDVLFENWRRVVIHAMVKDSVVTVMMPDRRAPLTEGCFWMECRRGWEGGWLDGAHSPEGSSDSGPKA